jgi:hypothetical protein
MRLTLTYNNKRFKYFTSLFLPSNNFNGIYHNSTKRFANNAIRDIENNFNKALPFLEKTQELLKDDMVIFLDENLKIEKPYIYNKSLKSRLNITYIKIKPNGMWNNKILTCILALEKYNSILWFDMLDAFVKEKLNKEEIDFLYKKAENTSLVVEWEIFKCFGPHPEGTRGRIKQPQTSIFFCNSDYILKEALKTKIDHDQIALLFALQKSKGLYQEKIDEKTIRGYSSEGLFYPGRLRNGPLNKENKYKPKIFHKYKI